MANTQAESAREFRKRAELRRIIVKEDIQARFKIVAQILRKDSSQLTDEEKQVLDDSPAVVQQVLKRQERAFKLSERTKEIEDSSQVLEEKCLKLAEAIKQAKCAVVYSGAGISTAACIPDYRGPNGVWTLLQKGQPLSHRDLTDAEPTLTHMAITKLYQKHLIHHVVSQNCDGLHLRSGLPQSALSELHGNMYIEVCRNCRPHRLYYRLFDVTEKTALYKHKTSRKCHKCGHGLYDTIVHFGEKGTLKSPLNWKGAVNAAEKCDLIICLGSSLKVLRRYSCLWAMQKPPSCRPQLCIVNLQWTPKDHLAMIKIHGRCDLVMQKIMDHLALTIPRYQKDQDPLHELVTHLQPEELCTTTHKLLELSSNANTQSNQNQLATNRQTCACSISPRVKSKACTSSDEEGSSSVNLDHCYASSTNVTGFPICDSVADSTSESQCGDQSFGKCKDKHVCTIPQVSDRLNKELRCDIGLFSGEAQRLHVTIKHQSFQCPPVHSSSPEVGLTISDEPKQHLADDLELEPLAKNDARSAGWFGKGHRKWKKKRRRLS